MKGIVVGAGGTTRELLRRLGAAWEVTVIEPDRARLEQVRGIRAIKPVLGDGTSRLVLERAGLAETDVLVAATNDDGANLEICRLALMQGVVRVVALAADPERLPAYRELGVPAFSPDSMTARRLDESLQTRRITSQSFAHGKAEAIEFEVTASSAVRGRSLKELRARSWVVGAILRQGRLLIPHGDTIFEADDLVTVVGAGTDFAEIVKTFTAGQARFPLEYGKSVALAVEDKDVELGLPEACHLVRNSRASSLLLVHRGEESVRDPDEQARLRKLLETASRGAEGVEVHRRDVAESPAKALSRITSEESVGVIVRVPPRRDLPSLWGANRAVRLSRKTARPVLIARSSHPYERILVPARRTSSGRAAARAAIDLAVQAKASLTALAVVDPVFIAGPEAARDARNAISWLREEATVLGLNLKGQILRGNPVRSFMEAAKDADLLVLGVGRHRRSRFQVGVIDQAARRARLSVLVVPVQE